MGGLGSLGRPALGRRRRHACRLTDRPLGLGQRRTQDQRRVGALRWRGSPAGPPDEAVGQRDRRRPERSVVVIGPRERRGNLARDRVQRVAQQLGQGFLGRPQRREEAVRIGCPGQQRPLPRRADQLGERRLTGLDPLEIHTEWPVMPPDQRERVAVGATGTALPRGAHLPGPPAQAGRVETTAAGVEEHQPWQPHRAHSTRTGIPSHRVPAGSRSARRTTERAPTLAPAPTSASSRTTAWGPRVTPSANLAGPRRISRSWNRWVSMHAPRLIATPRPTSTRSNSVTESVSTQASGPTAAPMARRYAFMIGVARAAVSSQAPASCSWRELTISSRHTKVDHKGCSPGSYRPITTHLAATVRAPAASAASTTTTGAPTTSPAHPARVARTSSEPRTAAPRHSDSVAGRRTRTISTRPRASTTAPGGSVVRFGSAGSTTRGSSNDGAPNHEVPASHRSGGTESTPTKVPSPNRVDGRKIALLPTKLRLATSLGRTSSQPQPAREQAKTTSSVRKLVSPISTNRLTPTAVQTSLRRPTRTPSSRSHHRV